MRMSILASHALLCLCTSAHAAGRVPKAAPKQTFAIAEVKHRAMPSGRRFEIQSSAFGTTVVGPRYVSSASAGGRHEDHVRVVADKQRLVTRSIQQPGAPRAKIIHRQPFTEGERQYERIHYSAAGKLETAVVEKDTGFEKK
jgi:hypothetical protein